MERRELLKKLGLGTGIVTLSPVTLSLFQSCQNDLDWNPVFFNKDEIEVSLVFLLKFIV